MDILYELCFLQTCLRNVADYVYFLSVVALLIDLFVGLRRTATRRKEIQGDVNNV